MYNNNQSDNTSKSKGIGFVGALQLIFIAFKILGYIEWSWLWVLSPTWIYAAIVVILALIITIGMLRKELKKGR